jgi:hypothetical protein
MAFTRGVVPDEQWLAASKVFPHSEVWFGV